MSEENIVLAGSAPEQMSNEELGAFVASEAVGVLNRLDVLRPYFLELWKRFDALKDGETIQDCRTRTEFYEKILHHSRRSVQYILYGRPKLPAATEDKTYVQRLHDSGFVRRCQEHDPVLLGLVLAQATLLDKANEETDPDKGFQFIRAAAGLEGAMENHVVEQARLESVARSEAERTS